MLSVDIEGFRNCLKSRGVSYHTLRAYIGDLKEFQDFLRENSEINVQGVKKYLVEKIMKSSTTFSNRTLFLAPFIYIIIYVITPS